MQTRNKTRNINIRGNIYPNVRQYLTINGVPYQTVGYVFDDKYEYGIGIEIREVFGPMESHNHKQRPRCYVVNVSQIGRLE